MNVIYGLDCIRIWDSNALKSTAMNQLFISREMSKTLNISVSLRPNIMCTSMCQWYTCEFQVKFHSDSRFSRFFDDVVIFHFWKLNLKINVIAHAHMTMKEFLCDRSEAASKSARKKSSVGVGRMEEAWKYGCTICGGDDCQVNKWYEMWNERQHDSTTMRTLPIGTDTPTQMGRAEEKRRKENSFI